MSTWPATPQSRKALHVHLWRCHEIQLRGRHGAIGTSSPRPANCPAPGRSFFFAPAQIKKRRDEWGPGVLEGRIDEAWKRLGAAKERLAAVEESTGLDQAMAVYAALAEGRSDPKSGHIVRLA